MQDILTGFGIMVLAGAIAGIVAAKVKLPPVVVLLLVGMIIGPGILNVVDTNSVQLFAQIGSVLLLFMIGVEFSIPKLLSTGLKSVISSLMLVLVTFIAMHEVALLVGFGGIPALFVAAMFSMSSTALIMRILEQKGYVERQEIPSLVGMLVIEDIIAVFMLAIFSGLKVGSLTIEGAVSAILVAFAILGFSYIVLLSVLKKFSEYGLIGQTEEVKVLFAVALGLGMSAFASFLGVSPAIGAFLAGSLISALPESSDLEKSVRPFGLVFSSFFFISVGMFISPPLISSMFASISILIFAFMVVVSIAAAFIIYLQTSSGRSSIFAGLALIPLGEFSILLAQASVGVVPNSNLVGIAALGVLITSIICSITIGYQEELYLWLRQRTPLKLLSTLTHASRYFRSVIASFEPGGYFNKLFAYELNKELPDFLFLIGAGLFYWLVRLNFRHPFLIGGKDIRLDSVVLFLTILVGLIPLSRIFSSAKRLFDALSTIFSRTTPQSSKASVLRSLIIAIVFFFMFANFYIIVAILNLPTFFNWISVIFALMCIFFLWSSIRSLSLGFFLSDGKLGPLIQERIVASDEDIIRVNEDSQEPATGKKKGKKKNLDKEE